MEALKSLLILEIIVILLEFPSYTNAHCSAREYKVLPGGLSVFMKTGVKPVFDELSGTDRNTCFKMCAMERFCHVLRSDNNGHCQIFHSMKDIITVKKSTSASMKTYYETADGDKWHEIYFVKTESGFDVEESFLGIGAYENWGPATCTRVLCPDLFRSNFIDAWTSLPLTKVKFSLFKNNTEVKVLIFDGKGTNSTNWFSMSRVLVSPWKDVHKGATLGYFLLRPRYPRNFEIYKSSNSCEDLLGWIAVLERNNHCTWDKQPAYPYIIYSNKTEATKWSEEYATADSLAIYMSF